ncbi:hypothetical protein OOZ54_12675 [Rhodopseudomonas palustris]|uniref:hypothetical protein n=1 Tax=Rhodopseudomonas palustris TaxID=1076 RepID=UPI0022F0E735|nr:hypothetical protein [Rhodopseudomonas palustris]WBU27549.1 hypothetical protein OOZ54_12675 [Rhodopseudomonas palustris]
MFNDCDDDFRTGEQLLAEWGCANRQERLERAALALREQINEFDAVPEQEDTVEASVRAMMSQLDRLHVEQKNQSLAGSIDDQEVFCSCSDAYRMGAAALNS